MDCAELEASNVYQTLAARTRWESFRDASTDVKAWQDLNADFNNGEHLFVTASIGADLCFEDNVDREITELVMMTGLAHDAAEAVTGDINFNLKTDEDTAEEITILASHSISLFNPRN